MGSALYHRLQTIAADKADRLAGAGDIVTVGADIAVVVVRPCGGRRRSTFGGGITPCNADTVILVAVQLDFLNIVVQYPVEQFIRRACYAPPVFL